MSAREGWLVGALLLAFVILVAGSLERMTLTFDETGHYRYGWNLLSFDASRGGDNSKMPFSMLNALPRRLAAGLDLGPVRQRLESIEFGRYATMLGGALLGWLVFRWARALYGPPGGLLALTLYVFDPNILAHAGLVTNDLYAAWMMALAVWSFWRVLTHEGPGLWRVAAGGAVLFGLAQLAKYTCAYLVPILALIAIGHAAPGLWADVRAGRWRAVGAQGLAAGTVAALYAVAFLLVVNAGYWGHETLKPLRDYRLASDQFRAVQARLEPLGGIRVPVPAPYLEGLDLVLLDERGGANPYLLGQVGKGGVPGRRFPEYFAVAWLYKMPIPTLVLLLLALVA
jgi:4-amino-4-deoxy-L-arabinose transferase-like glycosyltransferase